MNVKDIMKQIVRDSGKKRVPRRYRKVIRHCFSKKRMDRLRRLFGINEIALVQYLDLIYCEGVGLSDLGTAKLVPVTVDSPENIDEDDTREAKVSHREIPVLYQTIIRWYYGSKYLMKVTNRYSVDPVKLMGYMELLFQQRATLETLKWATPVPKTEEEIEEKTVNVS